MKKIIKAALLVLIVLFLGIAGYFAAGYFTSLRQKVSLPDLTVKLAPENGAALGQDVTATLDFQLPLCCSAELLGVVPPAGTVAAGEKSVTWHALRFDRRSWKISLLLRPLKRDKKTPGSIRFAVKKGNKTVEEFSAEIPAVEILPGNPAEHLMLAPEVVLSTGKVSRWYWLLLLLVPALAAMAYYLRRPKKARELSEWEKAVQELSGLREKISSHQLPPEKAFISLTEFMRRYLEKRFGLPVTRSTAQEFVNILDKYGSSFPEESRPFLREFLNEADLVKFARAVPENALIERSAESAERFVEHTRPESEAENV